MTASNRVYRLWLNQKDEPQGNGGITILAASEYDSNDQLRAPWDKTLAVYGWWVPLPDGTWEILYHRRYLNRTAALQRAASIEKHNPGITVQVQRSKAIEWEALHERP